MNTAAKILKAGAMSLACTIVTAVSIMVTVLFVPNWWGFAIGCGLGGNLSTLTWFFAVRSGLLGPVPGIPSEA